VSLSEESVKERWGDPWLKYLPATNVGSNHGFLVGGLLGEGGSGEGRDSEGLHLLLMRCEKNNYKLNQPMHA